MKNIDLVKKVRGYVDAAKNNGCEVLTVPLHDLFPLIDQLEAAQRVWPQLEDMTEQYLDRNAALSSVTRRAEAAEAELKRRDDAVPVAWILHARGGDQLTQDGGYVANAEGISGIGSTPLYASAPAAAAAQDRNMLRDLVDAVWNYATESTTVPCTGIADGLIDRVFSIPPQSVESRYAAPHATLPPVTSVPKAFSTIAASLRSQDNRCTSHPVFCVFEKHATPAAEGYNDSRIEWYNPDREIDATETQYRRLEALYQAGRCDDNDYGHWRRLAMCDIDVFVTACFTQSGCEEYMRINGHNLRKPFIYVMSAYRNAEWQAIRDWLMKQEAAPGDGDE